MCACRSDGAVIGAAIGLKLTKAVVAAEA
jgi:hypothetical protein